MATPRSLARAPEPPAPLPPSRELLEDTETDPREAFNALRAWAKTHQRRRSLREALHAVGEAYRESSLAFLSSLPARKQLFSAQANELVRLFEACHAELGLGDTPDSAVALGSSEHHGQRFSPLEHGQKKLTYQAEVQSRSVLDGMPPVEKFLERSRHHPGDVFKDFRRWLKRLSSEDLAVAGDLLEMPERRDVLLFLLRLSRDRPLYSRQAKEALSRLLPLKEWTRGGLAREPAVAVALELIEPEGEPSPEPCQPCRGQPLVEALEVLAEEPPDADAFAQTWPPSPPPSRNAGEATKVEGVLVPSNGVAFGENIADVESYEEGSPGCSGLAPEGELGLVSDANPQDDSPPSAPSNVERCRDLCVDMLRKRAGDLPVYFPHLHIDLQMRQALPMPECVRKSVERKIRRLERWTRSEKACVLEAPRRQTVPFLMAYALSRARATRCLGAVWIPLGTGYGVLDQSSAVCFQPDSTFGSSWLTGTLRVLVYDPSFDAKGHAPAQCLRAKSAVESALPCVAELLRGTGIRVAEHAELFGHGLRAVLGGPQAWRTPMHLESAAPSGNPAGAVTHLLATAWLSAAADGKLVDVVEVEATMAEAVADPQGRRLVWRVLEGLLQELADGLPDDAACRPSELRRVGSAPSAARSGPALSASSGCCSGEILEGHELCSLRW